MISEVHHVSLIVADIEASTNFYESVLGYRRTLRSRVGGADPERALGLPPGATGEVQFLQGPSEVGQLELIEWDAGSTPMPARKHDDVGLFLISFQVPADEMAALHRRLVEQGVECLSEPIRAPMENYGYIQMFAAKDPDGHLVEFVSLPTREEVREFRASQSQ